MTIRDTAEVANKVRADLVKEKFRAEHFKEDDVIGLMSYLVKIPSVPEKANLIELEKLKKMTAEEIRSEFAEKLNDGSLTFSTYTMNHLNKRKE